MATVLISSGAHWRNVHLPSDEAERQFAHRFDPDEVEDVPHQAWNFITYANCLGAHASPFVLISPPKSGDAAEQQHIEVELSDWVHLVQTATRVPVVIR
jgi:hypothetical protein